MPESHTTKRKYSYDPECGDLAKYFLPDGVPDEAINELAQQIQGTVEDFLVEHSYE